MLFTLVASFTQLLAVTEYDLIIRNGTVYDGTGAEPIQADIAIKGDLIIRMGDLTHAKARREINATGLAIAPGFIDMHAHLDTLLNLPAAESHVRQGVTTALGGPDGGSPWPLGNYLQKVEKLGIGMNVAYLIGHNRVRKNIMGLANRAPTNDEMELMKSQINQAMDEGAFGISTGLKYLPGAFSTVDEVIELSKVAAEKGGIYTSHLREEGVGLIESVAEAIKIGKQAKIPIVLTHHKAIGTKMWGASERTLKMVEDARAANIDVMMDQYPYNASYTGISVLIPAWARAGGKKEFKKRVADPKIREKIKSQIINNILYDRGGADLRRVQFAKVKWNRSLEGKTLHDWAVMQKLDPSVENGADLVIQAQLNGGASCVYFAMDEADVQRIMIHPQTMIASDGRLVKPDQGHPHPRWYGTFPRVLGHYVRDKKIMPLTTAIKKMTFMPAKRLSLFKRGQLKAQNYADIVIFDPKTIIDKATFKEPHQYPEGIDYVIVNGKLAVDQGKFKSIRPGRVLRKTQSFSN